MSAWAHQWLGIFAWAYRAFVRLVVVFFIALPIFVLVHLLWIFIAIPLMVITLDRVDLLKDALAYGLGFSLCLIVYGFRAAPRELGAWSDFREVSEVQVRER